MKPLSVIYWSRFCLGVASALLCAFLKFDHFLSGLLLAIAVYLFTHYFLKELFITKVKKTSKVSIVGIGTYFLTWLVTWILLYTYLLTMGLL